MESIKGQTALITGASMGIGQAIALKLAEKGVNLVLVSRSKDKLRSVRKSIADKGYGVKVSVHAVDVQNFTDVDRAVETAISELGDIDILINNAGLALGAPARLWELPIEQIQQMTGTNINGVMCKQVPALPRKPSHTEILETTYGHTVAWFSATLDRGILTDAPTADLPLADMSHSVIRRSMWPRKKGVIINVSSVTGLECPPFDGEAVYHASKAFLEGFTNSLRMETSGSDIKVLILRPGCVTTNFHLQRVKFDQSAMDEFLDGYEPLVAEDLADSVLYMLSLPSRISIKALDCVPTAQRALTRFDREWNSRHVARE